jgi:hypothetical protein
MANEGRNVEGGGAAIDAAREQLAAAATATVDEHLRAVAQRRVDDEVSALRDSGVWADDSISYIVSVRRATGVRHEPRRGA